MCEIRRQNRPPPLASTFGRVIRQEGIAFVTDIDVVPVEKHA